MFRKLTKNAEKQPFYNKFIPNAAIFAFITVVLATVYPHFHTFVNDKLKSK